MDPRKTLGLETQSTDSTKEVPVEATTEASDPPPRPEDPVPMSLDSADPVHDSAPSDASWTELYERTCGDPTAAERDCGRENAPDPRSLRRKNALSTMPFGWLLWALRRPSKSIAPILWRRWMALRLLKAW